MDEIRVTTHDEYGLKANGLLHTLELFDTLFGIRLGYHLFDAAENVSLTLQRKNILLQDVLLGVETAKSFYKRMRSYKEFSQFNQKSVSVTKQLDIVSMCYKGKDDDLQDMKMEVHHIIHL